ncbi:MAG: universal stress protein [Thermodesulfobacteriota bacterium]
MDIKKILFAFDGSSESLEALNLARLLAERFNSEIICIHVIAMSTRLIYKHFAEHPESKFNKWMEKVRKEYKAKLSRIEDELRAQGISCRVRVLKGEPSKKIAQVARREEADLIVVGKRGLGLIDRMLTGSTTLKVLRESKIPVLAVKRKDQESTVNISNILVPLDIYEESDSALNYAIDLAERIKANVSVVYAFSLYAYDYEMPYTFLEDLIKLCSEGLAKRVNEVKLKRTTHIEINSEVIHGISPAGSIVDYASSNNFDLIIMNTHGRKGIQRFILGSVTEKVVQNSPCSVLVLRP